MQAYHDTVQTPKRAHAACEPIAAASGAKTKRRTVTEDAEEPDDPISARALFMKDMFAKHPSLEQEDSDSSQIAKMWDELSPQSKMMYYDKFRHMKEEYDVNVASYEKALSPSARRALKAIIKEELLAREPCKPLDAFMLFLREPWGNLSACHHIWARDQGSLPPLSPMVCLPRFQCLW